jgi:hypothetical protein
MVKVISFALVLAAGLWVAWYFGALQGVGSAFDDWMRYIGVTGNESELNKRPDSKGSYWDNRK